GGWQWRPDLNETASTKISAIQLMPQIGMITLKFVMHTSTGVKDDPSRTDSAHLNRLSFQQKTRGGSDSSCSRMTRLVNLKMPPTLPHCNDLALRLPPKGKIR
ncbi:hypothetical protein JTL79_35455, partial [Pseudomonas aeruginosa]|nr:hypothetical protein [Pseudomonas aeruginosa]